jgi:hypothetical protein
MRLAYRNIDLYFGTSKVQRVVPLLSSHNLTLTKVRRYFKSNLTYNHRKEQAYRKLLNTRFLLSLIHGPDNLGR